MERSTRHFDGPGKLRRAYLVVALGLSLGAFQASAAHAFVYWSAADGDQIGRANLDGTGIHQPFIEGAQSAGGVAVNASQIFWSDGRAAAGSIGHATIGGTGVNQYFVAGATQPHGVAIDGQHVYWANQLDHSIGRADLDRSHVDQHFIGGLGTPRSVAVDGTHIYWTDEDTQAIGRATLTASDGQPNWAATAGTADGLAVRAGVVYWSVPSTGRIYSRPVAGSTTIQRVDTGGQQPQGLAVDDTHIYWADSLNSRIGRAGLYGSHVTPSFINTLGDGPVGVAVDNPSPSIFGFSLSKRRFRPAGRTHPGGTTFRFGLAEPARVRITIDQLAPGRRARGRCRRPTRALRNHRRCTRRLRKTTITRSVREGLNSVNFNGRVGRHALKPGSYEATLFASVPGAPVSRTRPARFVVTR